jgi:hypothetical protein
MQRNGKSLLPKVNSILAATLTVDAQVDSPADSYRSLTVPFLNLGYGETGSEHEDRHCCLLTVARYPEEVEI